MRGNHGADRASVRAVVRALAYTAAVAFYAGAMASLWQCVTIGLTGGGWLTLWPVGVYGYTWMAAKLLLAATGC